MVAGSVIMAINFLSAPQWGQSKTSSSKALRINSAHDRHLAGGACECECRQCPEEAAVRIAPQIGSRVGRQGGDTGVAWVVDHLEARFQEPRSRQGAKKTPLNHLSSPGLVLQACAAVEVSMHIIEVGGHIEAPGQRVITSRIRPG